MLIAGVAIPVKNKCGKANISWIKDKVALCIYSKNAKPTSIKDKANFVDPVDFALIKPLDIPFISEGADRKLIVNYDGKIQWYFNNDPIVGASSKNIIPLKAGTYFVKVFNECGQSARSRDYLFILTDKKLQSEQTLSIDAFPNPFIDNFHIKLYTPNSEKVRVRVFNCIGNLVYQQEYQLNSIGEYDLNISMNDPHLSSGYYFAEVQVANTTKTIRLIKLNT
ncbi:MAG TPA: T9SS type A sorting domain-containing protein, partial [Cytophagaceae bacterium]